ncbi:hypothetical protein LCGC14_2842020 [marine sediment metagenome]|uniref:PD-(D/E)XK endonuclease-like domain-containing protein n=1 Tax=marine sediment metagenome TaxID=412755 RepID=A0A0F8YB37_9ZZZZ
MINLAPAIEKVMAAKKRAYPCHVNRISSMGHPCERYLYHCRADWDKAKPIPDSLQGIFDQGKTLEPILVAYFNTQVGPNCEPPLRIVGQQITTADSLLSEYEISGSIDGFLQQYDDCTEQWSTFAVVDIKTAGQNPYRGYCDLRSLYAHTWSTGYIAQLMLYSFAHNLQGCVIFFVDKSNIFFNWKPVEFGIDMGLIENLLQKAARVNEAVKAKTPPETKINRPDYCKECRFRHICLPDLQIGTETKIITSGEVIGAITEHQRLKPLKSQAIAAEKRMKEMLVPGQNAVAGGHMLEWTEVKSKGKRPYWKLKIKGD